MNRFDEQTRTRAMTLGVGGAGVLITALALGLLAVPSAAFVAPFASTAALKYSAPENAMTQPRSVLGGHLLGAVAGVLVGLVVGNVVIGSALAAAVAMLFMLSAHAVHPPAAAVAIIAFQHPDHPWDSLAAVAIAGAVSVACAVVLYRLLHRQAYPANGWSNALARRVPAPANR